MLGFPENVILCFGVEDTQGGKDGEENQTLRQVFVEVSGVEQKEGK